MLLLKDVVLSNKALAQKFSSKDHWFIASQMTPLSLPRNEASIFGFTTDCPDFHCSSCSFCSWFQGYLHFLKTIKNTLKFPKGLGDEKEINPYTFQAISTADTTNHHIHIHNHTPSF